MATSSTNLYFAPLLYSIRNRGVLWIHNDNYDAKRVYAVDVVTGEVRIVVDLTALPGINEYSDFEDIGSGHCPPEFPSDGASCIFVSDGGNNAEWGKGEFVYVFEEPEIPASDEPASHIAPERSLTIRMAFDSHPEPLAGPNLEAMAVKRDGTRFWMIAKTFRNDGAGPAGVWEGDLEGGVHGKDACAVDFNGTWTCALSDDEWNVLTSHPLGQAKLEPKVGPESATEPARPHANVPPPLPPQHTHASPA